MECSICLMPAELQLLACKDQFCDQCIQDLLEHGMNCPICNAKCEPIEFTAGEPVEIKIEPLPEYTPVDIRNSEIEKLIIDYQNALRQHEKDVENYQRARVAYNLAAKRIEQLATEGRITQHRLTVPRVPPYISLEIVGNQLMVGKYRLARIVKSNWESIVWNNNEIVSHTQFPELDTESVKDLEERNYHYIGNYNEELGTIGSYDVKNTLLSTPGSNFVNACGRQKRIGIYNDKYLDIYRTEDQLIFEKRYTGFRWDNCCIYILSTVILVNSREDRLLFLSMETGDILFQTVFKYEVNNVAEYQGKVYIQISQLDSGSDHDTTYVYE